MIWWKYPEHAVETARMLKERNVDFEMLIIGNGEKKAKVMSLIEKYELSSNIKLLDFMSPDDIRKNMEESDVYLFTSGREEGWGVVLNEAINSRCAVIANTYAGSTTYLLTQENACFYDGSLSGLSVALDKLLKSDIVTLRNKAYEGLEKFWTPKKAVESLLNFIDNNEPCIEGPCSLA